MFCFLHAAIDELGEKTKRELLAEWTMCFCTCDEKRDRDVESKAVFLFAACHYSFSYQTATENC